MNSTRVDQAMVSVLKEACRQMVGAASPMGGQLSRDLDRTHADLPRQIQLALMANAQIPSPQVSALLLSMLGRADEA